MIRQALTDKERGLGELRLRVDDEAAAHLAKVSDGDARKCLNALEIAARTTPPDRSGLVHITLSAAEESIQRKAVVYDADGDAHYDTISAFIKSLRGSDPDAALYWLAKMLYAGEDIRFIARRLIICASEDVGMADSNALVVAVAAQQAVEFVGLPEAQLILAHATVYVATAPKSNRCTVAIGKASAEVREGRTLAIPKHLRDTHYKAAKKLGHGEGYKYSHDYEGAYVPQAYLPEGRIYYEPSENGMEKRVKERLDYWRKLFDEDQKRAVFARFDSRSDLQGGKSQERRRLRSYGLTVTLTVPELLRRFVVCITEMLRDGKGATLAHLGSCLSDGHGAAIALRCGSDVNCRVSQGDLSFGQTDKFHGLLRGDGDHQSWGRPCPRLRRADDDASRDEAMSSPA